MARLSSFRHDGLTFDVDDHGDPDGEVVVLLHGFPQTRAAWAPVVPALIEAGFRVLAPDQRGYSPGARPRRRRDYTIDRLKGDVLALADTAGAGRVHVVGHDWGGAVAWALAADHGDRLHSVSVLTTPHPAAMQRAMLTSSQGLKSAYMAFFLLPFLPEALFRSERGGHRVVAALEGAGLPPDDAAGALAMLRRGALTPALHWYRAVPLDARRPTGPSRVRTLYVWASADVALGRRAAELTAAQVEAPYRFEVLEGVGHFVLEEAPDRVAAMLVDHLGARGD